MTTDVVLDTAATNSSLPMNATLIGTIDPMLEGGSFDTSRDHDWYAVSLTAGHTYNFSALGFVLSTLKDVAVDLRDANRTILNIQGVVDSGLNGTAIFNYTAP